MKEEEKLTLITCYTEKNIFQLNNKTKFEIPLQKVREMSKTGRNVWKFTIQSELGF